MKKILFVLLAVIAISVSACKNNKATKSVEENNVVAVDSVAVVDSVSVATDTVVVDSVVKK